MDGLHLAPGAFTVPNVWASAPDVVTPSLSRTPSSYSQFYEANLEGISRMLEDGASEEQTVERMVMGDHAEESQEVVMENEDRNSSVGPGYDTRSEASSRQSMAPRRIRSSQTISSSSNPASDDSPSEGERTPTGPTFRWPQERGHKRRGDESLEAGQRAKRTYRDNLQVCTSLCYTSKIDFSVETSRRDGGAAEESG
jgi:hypothetical protein